MLIIGHELFCITFLTNELIYPYLIVSNLTNLHDWPILRLFSKAIRSVVLTIKPFVVCWKLTFTFDMLIINVNPYFFYK
jgi:hypothetical protein